MPTLEKNIKYIEGTVLGDAPTLIKKITKGLDYEVMNRLLDLLEVNPEEMSGQINISMRTLHARKKQKHFNPAESERLIRLAQLYLNALKALGDAHDATDWMKTPNPALNGETPLNYARTGIGAREVEELLGRIEHGVFS